MLALKRYLASGLSGLVVLLLVGAFGAGSVMAAQDCKRPAGGKVHVPKTVNFDINSTEIGAADQEQLA